MKQKRIRAVWTVTALVVVLSLALPWTVLAKVWTDQEDYSPGDIVTIHGDNSDGAGYLGGETVHVDVSGPNGYTAACDATADGDGAWSCQVMLWPDSMAVGTYDYTATGQISGVSQSRTFTDGNLQFSQTGLPWYLTWSVRWGGVLKSAPAYDPVVFGGSGGTAGYLVTSPVWDWYPSQPGLRYVASPAWGTATQPATGTTTVKIVFTRQHEVAFAVSPSGGGSTSPSATAYYDTHSTIPISAIPATGYTFSSWSASMVYGSITFANASSASTTATIDGRGTITANFNLADSTPPVITPNIAGTLGLDDWYVSDVMVSRTVTDPESAITSKVGCDPTTIDYDTAGVTLTCTATSAGGTNSQSVTIKRDATPPTISAAVTTAPNAAGWYKTDVTVHFTCYDALSGIPAGACPADEVLSSEGAAVSSTAQTVTDAAGNTSDLSNIVTVSIDKTKPTIAAAATTAPNAAGWYNANVTVHFTCNDALSGIPAGACSADQVLSAEGAAVSSTAQTVTDAAGNTSDPSNIVTVSIDKTAPMITWSNGPQDGESYYFGFVPPAPTCSAEDALSGVNADGCSVSGYGTTVGTHTLTAKATDKADNTRAESRTYTVLAWTLKGFYQPVDMGTDVWNTVKGGSTVPLKFEIFAGAMELTDTAYVKSFATTPVACSAGTADAIEFTTTGGTELRYDFTEGQFIQNWKTPRSPGACFRVTMTTQDGSSLAALFKLK